MATDKERIVQDKVIGWFKNELGYRYLGNLEGMDNKSLKEDLLTSNLKERGYTDEVISKAVIDLKKEINNDTNSLYQVNKKVYSMLRYGKSVKEKNYKDISVHFIDWRNIDKNDFSIAEEVTVYCQGGRKTKRPDLVIYVNGIALAVIELKRSVVSIGEGIRQSIENQKEEFIRKFFGPVQLFIAGSEAEGLRYGVIETPEKYYLKWREEKEAQDDLSVEIRKLHENQSSNLLRNDLISMFHKKRLLSLIYDFMIFDAGKKKTARHNQYFANIAARNRIQRGEGGVIWNTQGSGKSLLMVWLSKWIIENIDNSRVVIITDREELDSQIEEIFYDVGENKIKRAKSSEDLRSLLNGTEASIICSLIHKYGHNTTGNTDIDRYVSMLVENLPKDYSAKGNIIAFIDECHRTNSGKLHKAVKILMPEAVLIGFTGTPLLKQDKSTTIEVFGSYIHTYKFNQGVQDGVVLDLRYEARDVDQRLTNKEQVDQWFDIKTRNLTDKAKQQLKQSWTTMNKLYSAKDRLEIIAQDIIFDMEIRPRLKTDRGTAMLVANSIYEACKYWEIFNSRGFKKCAVVTSFDINKRNVGTDLDETSEEDYKKLIYERMLQGKKLEVFEKEVKDLFKKEPNKMKLLIVVDKLLTGFDAPSASYLYIDKSMRDHDLFQAICRVNRPDGDDKDYGYIVDYKDLFKNVQFAMDTYTSDAFDGFDKEDVEGLIKNRFEEAKSEMEASRHALKELLAEVGDNVDDSTYRAYFCGFVTEENEKELSDRRNVLYVLTASFTRSFINCCEALVSDFGYSEEQVDEIREEIKDYNQLKLMIKLASNDYIDLKPYEVDMRYILDTYIKADSSVVVSKLADMTLVELLINSTTTIPVESIIYDLPGSEKTKPEIIEGNLQYEIVRKMASNTIYYGKLSNILNELIIQRKSEAISYEEYLKQVVELAINIIKPEKGDIYPDEIKKSAAKRNWYDKFNKNKEFVIDLHDGIQLSLEAGWKSNRQKQMKIKRSIKEVLDKYSYTEIDADQLVQEIFEQVKVEEEYNVQ